MNPIDLEVANWNAIQQLVCKEGLYLDNKNWDAWLNLFAEDAEYWVPAWTDRGAPTKDPKKEVSLIYYDKRTGLEDRVQRVRSGKSAAANLEARTCHFPHLMEVSSRNGLLHARINWLTTVLLSGAPVSYFGWADYEFRMVGEERKISRKKTVLANDCPNVVVDFYLI